MIRRKFGASAVSPTSDCQIRSNRLAVCSAMPCDWKGICLVRERKRSSNPSTVLHVKKKMVDGGKAVASNFESKASCAGLLILSASSTTTTWKDFPVEGT